MTGRSKLFDGYECAHFFSKQNIFLYNIPLNNTFSMSFISPNLFKIILSIVAVQSQ